TDSTAWVSGSWSEAPSPTREGPPWDVRTACGRRSAARGTHVKRKLRSSPSVTLSADHSPAIERSPWRCVSVADRWEGVSRKRDAVSRPCARTASSARHSIYRPSTFERTRGQRLKAIELGNPLPGEPFDESEFTSAHQCVGERLDGLERRFLE